VSLTNAAKVAFPSSGGTGGGALWFAGTGAPNPALGTDGDFYLEDNGDVWTKAGGVWGVTGVNLMGLPGADGTDGTDGTNGAPGTPGVITIPFVSDASANLTLTSMAAARDFLGASLRYTSKADLDTCTQCRLIARKMATAGFAGSTVTLAVSAINPTTTFVTGDWTNVASVGIAVANQVLDSGWQTLAVGLRVTNSYIAAVMAGGNGVISPVMGSIAGFFR